MKGDIQKVGLKEILLPVLDLQGMLTRELVVKLKDLSDRFFDAVKQFAVADVIVIAAPYWDLMFHAILKIYLENVTVSGITFDYSIQGIPKSLCRAKTLYYMTTAGSFIGQSDFGFSYVKALATNFLESLM